MLSISSTNGPLTMEPWPIPAPDKEISDPVRAGLLVARIEARRAGLVTGLGLGLVLVGVPIADAIANRAFAGAFSVGAPVLAAAGIGGWICGPAAWSARSRRQWLGTTLRLALIAVVIGAIVAGEALGVSLEFQANGSALLLAATSGVLLGLGAAMLGLLLLGVIALPFTLGPAIAWSWLMWMLRPHFEARP
jgi:hypothetical protein